MFANFEITKLTVESPDLFNFWIISIFFIITVLTMKQEKHKGPSFIMDKSVTDQARGVGILLVILGHLWIYCSSSEPVLIMSGNGVALFLLLSGFGVFGSLNNSPVGLRAFVTKRINRVMIPYWITTLFIILLDYSIADKVYSPLHIVFTFLGINVRGIMHHFDYVRWYITFLIFWYIVLYLSFRFKNIKYFYFIPLIIGVLLMPLDYYVLKFGWYQFLAFPAGCIISKHYGWLKDRITKEYAIVSGFLLLFLTVLIKMYGVGFLSGRIPFIALNFANDANSLFFSIAIILMLYSFGKNKSMFLKLTGKYSYELFLLHGVFLVRYNPVLSEHNIIIRFMLFLVLLLILSFFFQKLFNRLSFKVKTC